MTREFTYSCHTCGELHVGIPSFGADYPLEYLLVPDADKAGRTQLTADTCVLDDNTYFVRGCVEIPVHGYEDPLVWGVWVTLSEKNFCIFTDTLNQEGRERHGPFFGWLTTVPPGYPDALLKTMVHVRPLPERPLIELEPTQHPLAVDQRDGIEPERVAEIVDMVLHRL